MTPSAIHFFTEDTTYLIKKKTEIRQLLQILFKTEKKVYSDINIIVCSDTFLKKLNKTYLNKTYLTDVITFEYTSNPVSGDIFISIDRIRENAKQYKQTIAQELLRIIIHGTLHLVGYKDTTEKDKVGMTTREDFYLKKFIRNN